MSSTNKEIAVFITTPNASLDQNVSLTDRDALKKLKRLKSQVVDILNVAIDAIGDDEAPVRE
jgi:hypothetical protein